MHYHILNASCLKDYFVHLQFEDGTEGVVNLERIVGQGEAFAPLKDKDFFCKMKLDSRFHTIEWPNGADLSPEMLYEAVVNSKGKVAIYEF